MKLTVNGVDAHPGHAVRNWGDVLAVLDEQGARHGTVVTDVAFDGVGEPSFRDAALSMREVASMQIDVRTEPEADVLLSALEEARCAIDPLRSTAVQVSAMFREYELERGHLRLVTFARDLSSLLVITGTIASASRFDLASVADAGAPSGTVATLEQHIAQLIDSSAAHDWTTVADLLDQDIVAALDRWNPLLTAMQRGLAGVTSTTC